MQEFKKISQLDQFPWQLDTNVRKCQEQLSNQLWSDKVFNEIMLI